MIAVDLDGTILEGGAVIREALIERLIDLAQRGVICVTATGRPLDFQIEVFETHGLSAASGVFSALIVDEREIFLLDSAGTYAPHATWNDAVRENWTTLHPLAMDVFHAAEAECERRGWYCCPHHSEEESFARGLPTLYVDDPERSRAICQWVQAAIRERGYPLASNRNVHIVQIYDAKVGKGPVLAELCRIFGIANRQALAIGDSTNDVSMLDGAFGFRGATVGNADGRVKALVREEGGYVATARSGLGVIEILDMIL